MTETLLIITIILLVGVIGLLIYLVLSKRTTSDGVDTSKIKVHLEEGRIKTIEDLNKSVSLQKEALVNFSVIISENITKFEKANQKEIVDFLNKTKEDIKLLQHDFDIKSAEVNLKNEKQVNELLQKTTKEIQDLKTKIIEEIEKANKVNNEHVNENNLKVQTRIQEQVNELKEQVKKSLESGFEKNEKAMHEFIEKMALLDATSRQMENLQKEINRFNRILDDQKTRGNFGEGVLEQIFENIFGKDTDYKFYQKQVNLTKTYDTKEIQSSRGKQEAIVDFVYYIYTNNNERIPLSIDAKFPYTNYVKILDDSLSKEDINDAEKVFKANVKERIKEVSKYIIEGVTAPYAIMFIPAEAVFIDIYKRFPDIIEEARKKQIVLASPSLIVTIIQMMQMILKDYVRRNNADQILNLIDGIGTEFIRFVERFDKHKERIVQLSKSVDDLDITHGKIIKRLEDVKDMSSSIEASKEAQENL